MERDIGVTWSVNRRVACSLPRTRYLALLHVVIHALLHGGVHAPLCCAPGGLCSACHRKVENRSCVGNDVMPLSACQSAASSSLVKLPGAEVLNSATHDTL